jgi:hypothetical protein
MTARAMNIAPTTQAVLVNSDIFILTRSLINVISLILAIKCTLTITGRDVLNEHYRKIAHGRPAAWHCYSRK